MVRGPGSRHRRGGGGARAGEDAFASGADISEVATHRRDAASAAAYEAATARAIATLLGIEKPVAATIHGVCIGRGLAIAACADLRVPADDARFTPRRPGSASVTTSRDSSGCRATKAPKGR